MITSNPSTSPMVKEPSKTNIRYKEYEDDALYSIGFPIPTQDTTRVFLPRPEIPIKNVNVTIEWFIHDKMKPNSCIRSLKLGRKGSIVPEGQTM